MWESVGAAKYSTVRDVWTLRCPRCVDKVSTTRVQHVDLSLSLTGTKRCDGVGCEGEAAAASGGGGGELCVHGLFHGRRRMQVRAFTSIPTTVSHTARFCVQACPSLTAAAYENSNPLMRTC
eukprot:2885476-Rhodomonas_salina.1